MSDIGESDPTNKKNKFTSANLSSNALKTEKKVNLLFNLKKNLNCFNIVSSL
jgi:hypothetical protein